MKRIELDYDFLAPYYIKGDCFPNLLARATYLTKYCRDGETWTDTIRRVVEGNCNLDPRCTIDEAKQLFDCFWTMQALPPGRGLWTGGVKGMVPDAAFNCWNIQISKPDDWCWVADRLMLGGGVGVSLAKIDTMPVVSSKRDKPFAFLDIVCDERHADYKEVIDTVYEIEKERKSIGYMQKHRFIVPDSREGWVEALQMVLHAAYRREHIEIDVSRIRKRGSVIKTFGGVACGPGPLVRMLMEIWQIVDGAHGRKLNSVECLDITNHIGFCIKSGNVRRSSLLILGHPYDMDFRNAKKDLAKVLSHRHTSNNSLMFTSEEQIQSFDWYSVANDMALFGEPGIVNMVNVWKTDPFATGFNPCGEQSLWDGEACNLAEVFQALRVGAISATRRLTLATRYAMRQRLPALIDPVSDLVGKQNMRIGVALGGLCDFSWTNEQLVSWRDHVIDCADHYADELGVNRPITKTTVKPSGTISLLCGSSPGNHAAFDRYYIRRVRLADNDPMVGAFKEAGLTYEPCVYDKTGHTLVFSFPMQSVARVTVKNDSVENQFARQLAVQTSWADNAVSQTITFDKNNIDELADCLRRYVPLLKSTSCLPSDHGYQQPPYESIDEHTFVDMNRAINYNHPLTTEGWIETEECAGGSCPIR